MPQENLSLIIIIQNSFGCAWKLIRFGDWVISDIMEDFGPFSSTYYQDGVLVPRGPLHEVTIPKCKTVLPLSLL